MNAVLFISLFALAACGEIQASISSVSDNGSYFLSMSASKSYSPDTNVDATFQAQESTILQIPEKILVTKGNAGTNTLTLHIRSLSCTYTGGNSGEQYDFSACDSGHQANQTVDLEASDSVVVHIDDGDSSQGITEVQTKIFLSKTL